MDAACPERVGADRCGECGVDAPGDGDHDLAEPALLDVVADTEAESEPHLLELRCERDDDRWCGLAPEDRDGDVDHRRGGSGFTTAFELTPAYVAQPAADRLGGVEVHDEQAFFESGCARDDFALVVEHD